MKRILIGVALLPFKLMLVSACVVGHDDSADREVEYSVSRRGWTEGYGRSTRDDGGDDDPHLPPPHGDAGAGRPAPMK